MNLEEFRSDFLNEAASWASSDQNFRHSSFVEVAIAHLEDAGEVADFESSYFRQKGSHQRLLALDGYAFDEADASLRVFVAEPSFSDIATSLAPSEARIMLGRLRAFLEDAASGWFEANMEISSPAYGFAADLRRRLPEICRIRAYLISDSVLSSLAKDWPEAEVAGIPVEFHIWDIARFHRLHESKSGRDDLAIDLTELVDGGLPCIEAGTDSDDYAAYLCVVPGRALAEMYEEYGSRLLEANVRSFLTVKGRVNKGIRNTILHDASSFFAFNNGIAATASKVTIESGENGLRLVNATDLQIVNGGQTTASIASAHLNDHNSLEHVFVPMKLSVIAPEKSGEMIPSISRYANSQNKVSDADFFANHDYHRRLQEISRRLWAPARPGTQHETHWFYERARASYLNETAVLSPARKRRFIEMNPRNQVITKTDLAKSENAWAQRPNVVSKGAQKNFMDFADRITKEWDADPDRFSEHYFRSVVGRVILFRRIEEIVSAQPWYQGGYRANVVAYTLARLARLIEDAGGKRRLDVEAIWQRQGTSAALDAQLGVIALAMNEVITTPQRGIQNVTEWAKHGDCWERAKGAPVDLLPEMAAELCDSDRLVTEARSARALQHMDSGIGAQATVVGLGSAYWTSAWTWAQKQKLIGPAEDSLMRQAAGFGSGLPTDFQCVKLLALKKRLELEGLAPPERSNPASAAHPGDGD
jgi:hypothetical protein